MSKAWFPMLLCSSVTLLLCARSAKADVIVVQEQTQAAIQDALNRVQPPGTVVLPAGLYQIEGTLLVRNDQLTLQGAGSDQTILFRQVDGTTTSMLRSTGHAQVRVTGIAFLGVSILDPDGQELSNGQEVGVLLENAIDFRVDHCFFSHTGFAGVRTNGSSSGVVDHCTFDTQYKPAVGTDGYGVVVYGIDSLEGEPFGSDRATFIEDSSFRLCRHAAAANKGARYVFRFNYVSENVVAHAVDAHGHEYGSTVGTEWIDVHDNLIENPSYLGPPCGGDSAACYAVNIRGGMGLIWNNTFNSYNQGINLEENTDEPTGPAYYWDNQLVINEGSHSRCPNAETSPMLCARGTMGTPTFSPFPPDDYVPFPYPHPLVTD